MDKIIDLEIRALFNKIEHLEEAKVCAAFKIDGTNYSHSDRGIYQYLFATGSNDGNLKLWLTSDNIMTFPKHSGPVTSVAFSPDGNMLSAGFIDGSLDVWNINSHTTEFTYRLGAKTIPKAVVFSPDGKWMASGWTDGKIRSWNLPLSNRTEPTVLDAHSNAVNSISICCDGSFVSGSRDKTLKLWKESNDSIEFTGHDGPVLSAMISRDGSTLISGSEDKTVKAWNARTGKLIRTLEGHAGAVNSVTFSSGESIDSIIISSSSDRTIRVWDTKTGGILRVISGHDGAINVVLPIPVKDQIRFLSCSDDKSIRIWDLEPASLAAFSKDTKNIALCFRKKVKLFDVQSGKVLAETDLDDLTAIDFSLDSDSVYVATREDLWRWEWRINQLTTFNPKFVNYKSIVVTSSDGEMIAALDGAWFSRTKLSLRKSQTGEEIFYTYIDSKSLAFSPDGSMIANGCRESSGSIEYWIELVVIPEDYPTRRLKIESDGVDAIAFSPDGTMIASGGKDKLVRLWCLKRRDNNLKKNVKSWKSIKNVNIPKKMDGHSSNVKRIVFSPDNTKIASGSDDGEVIVWDTRSGAELCKKECSPSWCSPNELLALVFSLDGNTIVSCWGDGRVRIWDVKNKDGVDLVLKSDVPASKDWNKHDLMSEELINPKYSELPGNTLESKNRLKELKDVLQVTKKIEIKKLALMFQIDESEVWKNIPVWAKTFEFIINGDYLENKESDIEGFASELDKQFGSWDNMDEKKERNLMPAVKKNWDEKKEADSRSEALQEKSDMNLQLNAIQEQVKKSQDEMLDVQGIREYIKREPLDKLLDRTLKNMERGLFSEDKCENFLKSLKYVIEKEQDFRLIFKKTKKEKLRDSLRRMSSLSLGGIITGLIKEIIRLIV